MVSWHLRHDSFRTSADEMFFDFGVKTTSVGLPGSLMWASLCPWQFWQPGVRASALLPWRVWYMEKIFFGDVESWHVVHTASFAARAFAAPAWSA